MIGGEGAVTVPTPGTPVQATSNRSDPAAHVSIHGVMMQALTSNTGNVYIGRRGMDKSTRVGVYAVLPIPTTNFLPTFSAALTIAPNGLALEMFYIDADEAEDGAIVTYLQT